MVGAIGSYADTARVESSVCCVRYVCFAVSALLCLLFVAVSVVRSFTGLEHALCHHGFGHLKETCHIGAFDVVDVAVGLCAIFHAVLMDVVHDAVQVVVNLLTCPLQTL